jgi:hypothetical protein
MNNIEDLGAEVFWPPGSGSFPTQNFCRKKLNLNTEDNVPAGKLKEKNINFFFILKVTEERSRIRIRYS